MQMQYSWEKQYETKRCNSVLVSQRGCRHQQEAHYVRRAAVKHFIVVYQCGNERDAK